MLDNDWGKHLGMEAQRKTNIYAYTICPLGKDQVIYRNNVTIEHQWKMYHCGYLEYRN